jgi:sugar lactone lactonase YvrE
LLTLYLIITNWGGARRTASPAAPNINVSAFITFPESDRAIYPVGLARDKSGVIHLSGFGNGTIYRVDNTGKTTVWLDKNNGITAPAAMGFAPDGSLYVVDFTESNPARAKGVVKRIAPDKSVSLVGALQTLEGLSFLSQMVFDLNGTLYISYTAKGQIWRLTPGAQAIPWLTLPAVETRTAQPTGLAFDPTNNVIYVGDDQSGTLYRVPIKQDGLPATPEITLRKVGTTYPALMFDEVGRLLYAQWTKENGEVNGYLSRLDDPRTGKISPLAVNLRAPTSILPNGNTIYVVNSDLPGLVPTSGGPKPPFTVDVILFR